VVGGQRRCQWASSDQSPPPRVRLCLWRLLTRGEEAVEQRRSNIKEREQTTTIGDGGHLRCIGKGKENVIKSKAMIEEEPGYNNEATKWAKTLT